MIENIAVLRHLWTTDDTPFEGTYLRFGPVTMDAAMEDANRYLDLYYGAAYTPERLHAWGPIGTPAQCAAWIRRFGV